MFIILSRSYYDFIFKPDYYWHPFCKNGIMVDNFEKKLNILVIDPDEDFARDVKLYLDDSYHVQIRPTIDQFDYTIILNKIDVIIIAIDLIDNDFLNLIEQLRNNHTNIKIIIMYTYISSDKEIEQKMMSITDDMIAKPFDVALLKDKVDCLIISV